MTNKITFLSTWNINCGIATYTKYLFDSLNQLYPNSNLFNVISLNNGIPKYISSKLVHLQHEFGTVPYIPNISENTKVIVTWHTVPIDIDRTIKLYESKLNVVGHIVHSIEAKNCIHSSSKDIYVINHGSTQIPLLKKEDAKYILGLDNINDDNKLNNKPIGYKPIGYKPIGFAFGFQSGNKNFDRLIRIAKDTDIYIIISGGTQFKGYKSRILNNNKLKEKNNIIFLDRYLTEEEVNLYSLASDILLFDNKELAHFSSSGALHRIIGAGRPVICSDTKHFGDIVENKGVLKFKNDNELKYLINYALDNKEQLGTNTKQYAEDTSWENIAKRHFEIYRRYVNVDLELLMADTQNREREIIKLSDEVRNRNEIIMKEIASPEDIDESLVNHSDAIYEEPIQKERLNWISTALSQDKAEHPIMEIGTACGYILNTVNGDIGVDIRPDRLMVAKRKYPHLKFYYGKILNLEPFYNFRIKTIIAPEILEHIPYDKVHHALYHLLRTAPIIYFTVPSAKYDISINEEHVWYPTIKNLTDIFEKTKLFINFNYDIKEIGQFLCGKLMRVNYPA